MLSVNTNTQFSLRPVVFGNVAPSRNERIDRHLARTDSLLFEQEFAQVLDRAKTSIFLQQFKGKKGFVVLDIDETALDNRGFFRDPKGEYYKKGTGLANLKDAWDRWVTQATIPAIPLGKKFIDWLNQQKVPYLFLTGIREHLGAASYGQLQREGLVGPACLGAFYRPDSDTGSTGVFKQNKRAELEKRFNMPVMASIGDRPGDMTGDSAKDFLLPGYVKALRQDCDNG